MGILHQWWIWIVIIIVIFIIIWIYSKITGTWNQSEEETKTADDTVSDTVSDTVGDTKREYNVTRIEEPVITSYSSKLSSDGFMSDTKQFDQSLSVERREQSAIVPTLNKQSLVVHDTLERTGRDRSRDIIINRPDEYYAPRKRKGKGKVKQSKGEAECLRVLEKLRGKEAQVQVRYLDELKNELTGHNLELDIFIPNDVNIGRYKHLACEYHGKHHYNVVKLFHPLGQESLNYQQWKDNRKVEMCDNAGIYLITVPYNVPFNKIEDFITHYLPENVYERQYGGTYTYING